MTERIASGLEKERVTGETFFDEIKAVIDAGRQS
jgi:hypothetical protein